MTNSVEQVVTRQDRAIEWAEQIGIVVCATFFVAVCAHITLPLPFTPVPLTLQNFAVLLVGLMLGRKRGFAVLALYLAEGAAGLPVFNPMGPGGVAQLIGPTGGYLLAYPLVAALAGWIAESGKRSISRFLTAGFLAEILLFTCGISWLAVWTHSFSQAVRFGLYWFVFAEVIKIMMAAAFATSWSRVRRFRP